MKTIQIPIPEGHTFDSINPTTGEVKFKPIPKDVMERIKTVDDVLKDNGLTQEQFDKQNEGLTADEIAYRIIKLLAKSLNEGWTPDWDNGKYDKYYPWFWMDGGSSGFRCDDYVSQCSGSGVGSRLCFKSGKLAEYAGKQFLGVYKQFMLIQ